MSAMMNHNLLVMLQRTMMKVVIKKMELMIKRSLENSSPDVNTTGPNINTISINTVTINTVSINTVSINTGSLNINTVSPTVISAPLEATHADFFRDA
ncbi:hypothetical protein Tco_0498130, partial [Tanacetum coccineum]